MSLCCRRPYPTNAPPSASMDSRIDQMDEKVTKLETMQTDLARVDERTKGTDENVREVKNSLQTITDHLLSEARAFGLKAVERATPRHRG